MTTGPRYSMITFPIKPHIGEFKMYLIELVECDDGKLYLNEIYGLLGAEENPIFAKIYNTREAAENDMKKIKDTVHSQSPSCIPRITPAKHIIDRYTKLILNKRRNG